MVASRISEPSTVVYCLGWCYITTNHARHKKTHTTTWNLVFMRPTGDFFWLMKFFFPPIKNPKRTWKWCRFFSTPPKKRSKILDLPEKLRWMSQNWRGGFGSSTLMDGIWTFQWKGKKPGIRYLGQLFFSCCLQIGWKKTSEAPAFFCGRSEVPMWLWTNPWYFGCPPGRQPANAFRKRRRILLNCGRFLGGDVLRFVLKNPWGLEVLR